MRKSLVLLAVLFTFGIFSNAVKTDRSQDTVFLQVREDTPTVDQTQVDSAVADALASHNVPEGTQYVVTQAPAGSDTTSDDPNVIPVVIPASSTTAAEEDCEPEPEPECEEEEEEEEEQEDEQENEEDCIPEEVCEFEEFEPCEDEGEVEQEGEEEEEEEEEGGAVVCQDGNVIKIEIEIELPKRHHHHCCEQEEIEFVQIDNGCEDLGGLGVINLGTGFGFDLGNVIIIGNGNDCEGGLGEEEEEEEEEDFCGECGNWYCEEEEEEQEDECEEEEPIEEDCQNGGVQFPGSLGSGFNFPNLNLGNGGINNLFNKINQDNRNGALDFNPWNFQI